MTLESLFALFVSLAGVATLIAALVNAGKQFGIVSDGQAPAVSLGLNVLGLAALSLLKIFSPTLDLPNVDATAGTVAQILVLVTGLAVQFGLTKGVHGLLRGAPVIGKSFSSTP